MSKVNCGLDLDWSVSNTSIGRHIRKLVKADYGWSEGKKGGPMGNETVALLSLQKMTGFE